MTDIGRRNILMGIPALAAGATMMNAASPASAAGTTTAQPLSEVTYLPVAAQKQLIANTPLLKGKPYESFFDPKLSVPTARRPCAPNRSPG